METSNFTRSYYAYTVRMKPMMSMNVIIVMTAIINPVVLVYLLYGAISGRVIGNASDI